MSTPTVLQPIMPAYHAQESGSTAAKEHKHAFDPARKPKLEAILDRSDPDSQNILKAQDGRVFELVESTRKALQGQKLALSPCIDQTQGSCNYYFVYQLGGPRSGSKPPVIKYGLARLM